MNFDDLSAGIKECNKCDLCAIRKNVVVGRGNSKDPKILFIGEAPGNSENEQGVPFIGKAGEMLILWISALGLDSKDYYITNVVKCIPYEDGKIREPTSDEKDMCKYWLDEQIKLLKPKYIVTLGKHAMQYFFPMKKSIMNEAGNIYKMDDYIIFISAHPAYYLRNPTFPWHDMLNPFYRELNDGKSLNINNNSKLILDIETTSLDKKEGKIKRIGFYSYKYKKGIITSDLNKAQEIINDHSIIIGFNIKEFDKEFLAAKGVTIPGKILDLQDIIKNRMPLIKADFGGSLSLNTICSTLGLGEKKEIPLSVLMAEYNTKEEKKLIDEYLQQDINLTTDLYEWCEKEFEPLKDFLSESAKMRYIHLTASVGSYVYQAICFMAGIEPLYNEAAIIEKDKYSGGFVLQPTVDKVVGNIYCLDFASAYPHAFMMQNLYTKANKDHICTKVHNHNGITKLKGTYCACEMGKIEKVLERLQLMRQVYKKQKDPREYAVKILSNTTYGISGDPRCLSLYDIDTASDCTATVRDWIQYAIRCFRDAGYEVIYSDTDSIYLIDKYNDETKMLNIRDAIIKNIKRDVPFPKETFDMGVECRIKAIFFFKDKDEKEKKKNYIYIRSDNKIFIKGLQVIKRNCTEVSKMIFNIIKPQIIKNLDVKFKKNYIIGLVKSTLEKDINKAAVRFKVGNTYKNTTSIQYQIYEKYGMGTHKLIRNNLFGIGKGIKLCSMKEAEKLKVSDLDLSVIESELSPFIAEQKVSNLGVWMK